MKRFRVDRHTTVLGPYSDTNGRLWVQLRRWYYRRGIVVTNISYPKFLMQKKLGRWLARGEVVSFRDGDFTNTADENLYIRTRSEVAYEIQPSMGIGTYTCPLCGKTFQRRKAIIERNNVRRGSPGPFCSRVCSGRFNRMKLEAGSLGGHCGS